jgi:hypothetical protein
MKKEVRAMVDLATASAAISAATAAIGLFDKIADQVQRFITKQPEPAVPREHRMRIEESDGDIVSRTRDGAELQRITARDLQNLPEAELRHITVLERSMENHYKVWEKVYPDLALIDSPVQKAKVEQQLEGVIRDMGKDLESILSFLESSGLYLDDHYMHIRHLVTRV